ncbi:MAG TPA: transporter, partial [Sorangium sp.]|nr:transporter [Sorangium sp.]
MQHALLFAAAAAQASAAKEVVDLNPLSLIVNASGVVMVVVWFLIFTAVSVWFIAVLKLMQLSRWARADRLFEQEVAHTADADELFAAATRHPNAASARVLLAMQKRRDQPYALEAAAKRAIVDEQKKASSLMSILASIGSASPFVGLFGTVWGIMDAFLRIGREKSAS